jgi:hypothetical protein
MRPNKTKLEIATVVKRFSATQIRWTVWLFFWSGLVLVVLTFNRETIKQVVKDRLGEGAVEPMLGVLLFIPIVTGIVVYFFEMWKLVSMKEFTCPHCGGCFAKMPAGETAVTTGRCRKCGGELCVHDGR